MIEKFWIFVEWLKGIPWIALAFATVVIILCFLWIAFATVVVSLGFLWIAWQAIGVSTKALSTWQRELRTRRHMQFWDDLNHAITEYVLKLDTAIGACNVINIGLEAYASRKREDDPRHEYAWVEDYVERSGKRDSERLMESLAPSYVARMSMVALLKKGRVLKISGYADFSAKCIELSNIHTDIFSYAFMIGDTDANWENENIRRNFDTVTQVPRVILERKSKILTLS